MKKKIYYYNPRYPEYGIKSFNVIDEVFVVSERYKYLYSLTTFYNLNYEEYDNIQNTLYISYQDEKGIMRYENQPRGLIYLSYDKKLLMESYKKDFYYEIDKLRKRFKKFRRVKNERN